MRELRDGSSLEGYIVADRLTLASFAPRLQLGCITGMTKPDDVVGLDNVDGILGLAPQPLHAPHHPAELRGKAPNQPIATSLLRALRGAKPRVVLSASARSAELQLGGLDGATAEHLWRHSSLSRHEYRLPVHSLSFGTPGTLGVVQLLDGAANITALVDTASPCIMIPMDAYIKWRSLSSKHAHRLSGFNVLLGTRNVFRLSIPHDDWARQFPQDPGMRIPCVHPSTSERTIVLGAIVFRPYIFEFTLTHPSGFAQIGVARRSSGFFPLLNGERQRTHATERLGIINAGGL